MQKKGDLKIIGRFIEAILIIIVLSLTVTLIFVSSKPPKGTSLTITEIKIIENNLTKNETDLNLYGYDAAKSNNLTMCKMLVNATLRNMCIARYVAWKHDMKLCSLTDEFIKMDIVLKETNETIPITARDNCYYVYSTYHIRTFDACNMIENKKARVDCVWYLNSWNIVRN